MQWSIDALQRVAEITEIVVALPPGCRSSRGGDGCPRGCGPLGVGAPGAGGGRPRRDGAGPRRRPPAAGGGAAGAGARRRQRRSHARRGDRGRPGQRHDQAGRRRRQGARDARPQRACGPSRRPRCSAAQALERALAAGPEELARATDDAWLVERLGGSVAVVVLPRAELQGHDRRATCAWPSWCWPSARPGPPILIESPAECSATCTCTCAPTTRTRAPRSTTPRPTPSATAGRPGNGGSTSWGSPSTSTASPRRSRSGVTRCGSGSPTTTSTPTAAVREHTDLRLGLELDFIPGREQQIERLLEGRSFDYVVGSVHFLGDQALDMDEFSVWEGSARAPRGGLGALLPDGRRKRPQPPLRHHRPPRPGEVLGRPPAASRGRPAPLLRAGRGSLRRLGRGGGAVHRRAAQARRRDLPGAGLPRAVRRRPASRWRCRATPTVRRTWAPATSWRWRCSNSWASTSWPAFRAGSARMAPVGAGQRTG